MQNHPIWQTLEDVESNTRLDEPNDRPRVTHQMNYEPEGFVELVGDAFGIVESRVKGDLERFKEFIEARGTETGGWRGPVEQTATT